MTPELLTLFGNFIGFGVMVWLVQDMRKEAREDREWMKTVLLLLIKSLGNDALENVPPVPNQRPTD
jgi:hypothetical protein